MARDIAKTEAYVTARHERKKIEMLFALFLAIAVLLASKTIAQGGPLQRGWINISGRLRQALRPSTTASPRCIQGRTKTALGGRLKRGRTVNAQYGN
jgi:hypothetical protein